MTAGWKPRTLILQHEEATPPGLMTTWLHEQSARVETVRIDEDDRALDPRDYDLIVSLGSEFAAFDDSIPFVPREAKLFEQAREADVPILGLCFGGQMLARVLGARLYRSEEAEIGWLPVRTKNPELIGPGPWFQWHFDTFSAPPGAEVIAETEVGPQAFVSGRSHGDEPRPRCARSDPGRSPAGGEDRLLLHGPLHQRADGAARRTADHHDRAGDGARPFRLQRLRGQRGRAAARPLVSRRSRRRRAVACDLAGAGLPRLDDGDPGADRAHPDASAPI